MYGIYRVYTLYIPIKVIYSAYTCLVHEHTKTYTFTVYNVQYTTYSVRRTLYVVYCTKYSIRGAMYDVHYTTYIVLHRTLYAVKCTTLTRRFSVYSKESPLHILISIDNVNISPIVKPLKSCKFLFVLFYKSFYLLSIRELVIDIVVYL